MYSVREEQSTRIVVQHLDDCTEEQIRVFRRECFIDVESIDQSDGIKHYIVQVDEAIPQELISHALRLKLQRRHREHPSNLDESFSTDESETNSGD